jgi:hypothetical protein
VTTLPKLLASLDQKGRLAVHPKKRTLFPKRPGHDAERWFYWKNDAPAEGWKRFSFFKITLRTTAFRYPSSVHVQGPRVTAVQIRVRCGSAKADLATTRPQATPETASAFRTDARLRPGLARVGREDRIAQGGSGESPRSILLPRSRFGSSDRPRLRARWLVAGVIGLPPTSGSHGFRWPSGTQVNAPLHFGIPRRIVKRK